MAGSTAARPSVTPTTERIELGGDAALVRNPYRFQRDEQAWYFFRGETNVRALNGYLESDLAGLLAQALTANRKLTRTLRAACSTLESQQALPMASGEVQQWHARDKATRARVRADAKTPRTAALDL